MPIAEVFAIGGRWVLGLLKGLSPRAWLILAGLLLAVGLFVWHQRHAAAEIKAAEQRGAAAEGQRIAARINRLTIRINQVAAKAREKQSAKLDSIGTDVHDLRLRGPGRAACSPELPEARGAGRPQPAPGLPAAAVDPVSGRAGTSFIALPFQPAVSAAGQCDANLDEVTRWRSWFKELTGTPAE